MPERMIDEVPLAPEWLDARGQPPVTRLSDTLMVAAYPPVENNPASWTLSAHDPETNEVVVLAGGGLTFGPKRQMLRDAIDSAVQHLRGCIANTVDMRALGQFLAGDEQAAPRRASRSALAVALACKAGEREAIRELEAMRDAGDEDARRCLARIALESQPAVPGSEEGREAFMQDLDEDLKAAQRLHARARNGEKVIPESGS